MQPRHAGNNPKRSPPLPSACRSRTCARRPRYQERPVALESHGQNVQPRDQCPLQRSPLRAPLPHVRQPLDPDTHDLQERACRGAPAQQVRHHEAARGA